MNKPFDYTQLLPLPWQTIYKSPVMDFVSLLDRQKIDWTQWNPDQFILEYAKFRQLKPEVPEQPIKEPEKIYTSPDSSQLYIGPQTTKQKILEKFLPTIPYSPPPPKIPFREQVLPAIGSAAEEYINTMMFGLPRLAMKATGLKEAAEEIHNAPEYQTSLASVAKGLGFLGGLVGAGGIHFVKAPIEIGNAISKSITTKIFGAEIGAKTPTLAFIRHIIDSGQSLAIANALVNWEGETAKEIFQNKIKSYIHGQVLGSLTAPANFITFGAKYPFLATLTRMGVGAALYDVATGQRPWDNRPLLQKVVDYGLIAWMSRRGLSFKDYHRLTQELNQLHEEAKANNIPTEILPTSERVLENLEQQPIPEPAPEKMSDKQLKEKFMAEQPPIFKRTINYAQEPEQARQEIANALTEAPGRKIKVVAVADDGTMYYPTRIPEPGEMLYKKKIKEVHLVDSEAFMRIASPRSSEKPERRILHEDIVKVNRYAKEVEPPSSPWLKPAGEIPVPNYLRRKIDTIADEITKQILDKKQQGGTYSIVFGEITPEKLSPYRPKTPEGQEGEIYIASAWAGRTFEIPVEQINKEVIKDYIYSNMDILSDFSRVFGFYIDNGKAIFDISTMTPDLAKLQRIGKTQQAAWKLFAAQTENLGGTGYTNAITEMELGPPRTRDWNTGEGPLTLYAISPIAPHKSKKAELNPTFFGAISFEGDNARLIEKIGSKIGLKEGAAPKLGFWTSETPEIIHRVMLPIEELKAQLEKELEGRYKDKDKLNKAVKSRLKKEQSKTYYLYKAQIDKANLLEINPQNPPANPALAAAAAGKKGWYDPVSKEVHLIAPIESNAIGIITREKIQGAKVSGQNIESFIDPIKLKEEKYIPDIANYNDDDIVITYENKPDAFGLPKKLIRAIEEIEDLPKKLKIPLLLRLTKGEESTALAARIASENPIYILAYYPEIKEYSYDLAREKVWIEHQHLEKIYNKVKEWKKELKQAGYNWKDSGAKILAYAIAQQEGGPELLQKLGLEVKELSPIELKIYNEMRQGFDEIYPEINNVRKLYGKDEMGYIKNYFTFMRNFTENPEISLDALFKYDSNYLHSILTEPSFPYAEERKTSERPLVPNAFDIYLKYMEKAISYISSAPLSISTELLLQPHQIKENGELKTISLKEKAPMLYNYLLSWRQYVLKYDVPSFLNQFPGLIKLIQRVNKNIALSLLSYNFRTFLIQPAALRNSIIELNPYWVLKGITKALSTESLNFARKNSRVLKPRVFEIFINQFYEAPKGSPIRQFLDKIGEHGILLLKAADNAAATMTWLGAYEKATKALRMSHEQAVKWADDVVIYTQASGHRHDLPIIQREHSMRFLLTMFQTFGINEWNYLGERVFGKGSPNLTPAERFRRIFWLLASTAAANVVFEDILKVRSPFPAPEKAIKQALEEEKPLPEIIGAALRELAEEIPIIGGAIRWSTVYRTFMPAGMQIFQDLIRLIHKLTSGKNPLDVLKPEDYTALCKLFGIPGVGETEKVIRRLKKGLPLIPALLGQRTDILDIKDDEDYLKRVEEFFKKFDIDGFVLNLQKQEKEQ